MGGPWLGHALAAGAVLSTAGLFMSLLLTNSRLPYVLARDHAMPAWLGAVDPRFGTPWTAIVVSAACYAAFAVFSFKELIVLNVWLYSLSLLVELAAFVRLRVTAPDMPRPWRVPGGFAGAIGSWCFPLLFCVGAIATAGWTNTMAGAAAALTGPLAYRVLGASPAGGRGGSGMKGVVNSIAYAGGLRLGEVAIPDISEVLKQPGRFVWIGLHEPDAEALTEVQGEFSLHDLAIEDAARAHQRPKLERYGDSLFVVLRTAHLDRATGAIEFGETHLFVGSNYVVSIRHGASLPYVEVRARCEASPDLLAKGPGFVFYALMDFIVDQYFPLVDTFEERLEELEDNIFRPDPHRGRRPSASTSSSAACSR